MLLNSNHSFDQLHVTVYDFEKVDDVLPAHKHAEGQTHITVCCRGSVKIITPEWEKILNEGNIIKFHPYQSHSIVALEDNSRVLNIPTSYHDTE